MTGWALVCLAVISILGGCKPSEKHYRSAYDQARHKREAEESARRELEAGVDVVGSGVIQEVDGARLEPFCGDTVWTLHRRLSPDEGPASPYSLAVARLSMRTNAQAMADDHPGWRAIGDGESFFVIAGEASDCKTILDIKRQFERENPGFATINLPGATVIVR